MKLDGLRDNLRADGDWRTPLRRALDELGEGGLEKMVEAVTERIKTSALGPQGGLVLVVDPRPSVATAEILRPLLMEGVQLALARDDRLRLNTHYQADALLVMPATPNDDVNHITFMGVDKDNVAHDAVINKAAREFSERFEGRMIRRESYSIGGSIVTQDSAYPASYQPRPEKGGKGKPHPNRFIDEQNRLRVFKPSHTKPRGVR